MRTVGEIIEGKDFYCVGKDQTVLEAAQLMTEHQIGAVPVLDENRLVGIFSERDLMTRVVAKGLDVKVTRIEEVMTKDIIVAEAGESYESCLKKMKQISARHLPVVSGNQLIGMVSMRDLLLLDLSEKDQEIKWLTAYIYYIPPGWENRCRPVG